MRQQISPERLHEIRKELGIENIRRAASSRNRVRIDLIKAKERLQKAEQHMARCRAMNNPRGVSLWIGEKLFAETLIDTLERRLRDIR